MRSDIFMNIFISYKWTGFSDENLHFSDDGHNSGTNIRKNSRLLTAEAGGFCVFIIRIIDK